MVNFLRELLPPRHPLRLLWHRGKAAAAALTYAFPARKLIVIGVTGTDGKTTTVGMTAHILHTAGITAGALSTAQFRIRSAVAPNALQKTSPSPFAIQRFLRRCTREGCTHVVLEYSSHGLVQGRTAFTWPRVAAITNTTPEHLDYHGSMEQYRADKGILFRMLHGTGTKILNVGDETHAMYKEIPSEKTIVYSAATAALIPSPLGGGLGRGGEGIPLTPSPVSSPQGRGKPGTTLWLSDIRTTTTGSSATLHSSSYNLPPTTYHLTLNIPGVFNVENSLCAIGCALACGIPIEQSCNVLASFPGIPGRMERIDEGQPFAVYVDFTVTPEAYRKTLAALRSQLTAGRRLLVLTGSCGDRMREKRPDVGRIVSQYADVMVVTNEDPYTENPERIIDEVWAGIDHANTAAHRIADRRQAMEFLLQKAEPGDIVILCGKGSDTTMWTREGQIPWDEREIARELLHGSTGLPAGQAGSP